MALFALLWALGRSHRRCTIHLDIVVDQNVVSTQSTQSRTSPRVRRETELDLRMKKRTGRDSSRVHVVIHDLVFPRLRCQRWTCTQGQVYRLVVHRPRPDTQPSHGIPRLRD